MFGRTSRFVLIFLIAFTCVVSVVGAPNVAQGSEGGFTGAETVVSKSGNIGTWLFPEPPGSPAVPCNYPVNVVAPHTVATTGPSVFPAQGYATQKVEVTVGFYRRLPDGTLMFLKSASAGGDATNAQPFVPGLLPGWSDLGSTVVAHAQIVWLVGGHVDGHVELAYNDYQTNFNGSLFPPKDACYPAKPASVDLVSTQGTVGSTVNFQALRFPHDPAVSIYFDGKNIGSFATDIVGNGVGSFVVPAAPMGPHTIKLYRFGRTATASFTVKPRIKLIPSTVSREQRVNISLRGYAKYETVNIRWKKGTSWVQVGQVKTSSTGSANINIYVPKWVPDGSTSVRGDGTYGRAQTNAVTVDGGPLTSSTVKATPSPTPAATSSPTPTSTSAPESTPEPTLTAVPTEQPETPVPVASETATAESTEEAISPTETPTVEPTTIPSETPEATATEGTS
jgi:hypothetical protein